MQLDFAFLALAAEQGEKAKVHALGVGFDTMAIPSLPAGVAPFYLVAKLLGEPQDIETEHTLHLEIVPPTGEVKQKPEGNKISVSRHLTDPSRASNVQIVLVIATIFETYGIYTFNLKIDGKLFKSIPLNIVEKLPE